MGVVASSWLDDDGPFVLFSCVLVLSSGYNQVQSLGLSVELTRYFDLLTSAEQKRYGHSRDSRHLS